MDRRALRAALLDAAPWLGHPEWGPSSVAAGACDRCEDRPRLLPTCGPTAYEALCRGCATFEGDAAWCDGHRRDGVDARAWAARLPDRWGDLVIVWWVATGELRTTSMPPLSDPADLPSTILAALTAE